MVAAYNEASRPSAAPIPVVEDRAVEHLVHLPVCQAMKGELLCVLFVYHEGADRRA